MGCRYGWPVKKYEESKLATFISFIGALLLDIVTFCLTPFIVVISQAGLMDEKRFILVPICIASFIVGGLLWSKLPDYIALRALRKSLKDSKSE